MGNQDDLFEMGKVALQKQSNYLKLKIEKEVAGTNPFTKEDQLLRAHTEWQEASNNYRNLFESQSKADETGSAL